MDRFKSRYWGKLSNQYLTDIYKKDDGSLVCIEDLNFIVPTVSEIDRNDIIEETCTGLKDKNGVFIYDGDIVEVTRQKMKDTDPFVTETAYIESYNNGRGFTFNVIGDYCDLFKDNVIESFQWYGGIDIIEILGNIHENKELLNDK